MTSPRHFRSRLLTALSWAAAVYVSLGSVAAQAPQGSKPAAPLPFVSAWSTSLADAPAASPAHDDQRLYLLLRSGTLAAISFDSGAIAWEREAGAESFVAAGGGLVFLAAGRSLLALDGASGSERWRYDLEAPVTAPPAWDNGWLLVGTADAQATMLRAAEGRLLWRKPLGALLRRGAAMTGDRLYMMLQNGQVAALSLTSGERLWERSLEAAGTSLTPLDDRLFVGSDGKYLYCLSSEDGKVKWRWRTGGAIVGTPVVDGEVIYFLALDNVLRALDRGNGHQRWKRGLSFRPIGGPVLAADLLLVPAGSPEIAAFRRGTGVPAGTIAADGDLVGPPVLLPSADGTAAGVSMIVVTGDAVQRLGPAPPVLPAHPIKGLPLFLPLLQDQNSNPQP